MLRELRPRALDVLLVVAVGLLAGYLAFAGDLPDGSLLPSLWANVATDAFAIWLGARLIDGLLARRQRRDNALLESRANLNFTMHQARGLLPAPRPWQLVPAEDEARWLEVGLRRRRAVLRGDEAERIAEAAARFTAVLADAKALKAARDRVEVTRHAVDDAFDAAEERDIAHVRRWRLVPLRRLQRELDRSFDDHEDTGAGLLAAAQACRAEVDRLREGLAPAVTTAVDDHLAAVETAVHARRALAGKVDGYVAFVRECEAVFLDRARGAA